jgi:hypothetical protein
MAVDFKDISNLKRQPVQRGPELPSLKQEMKGFPVPMGKQMNQPPRKLRFPKLKQVK